MVFTLAHRFFTDAFILIVLANLMLVIVPALLQSNMPIREVSAYGTCDNNIN